MVARRSGQQTRTLEDLDAVAGGVAGEPAPAAEDVRLVLPRRTCVTQASEHRVVVVDDEAEVRLRMHVTRTLGHMHLAVVVDVEPRARLSDAFGRLVHLTQ